MYRPLAPSPACPVCRAAYTHFAAWHLPAAMVDWSQRRQYIMNTHLPQELETSLQAEVNSGHFPSIDEAMAEAVRLLLSRAHAPSVRAADDAANGSGMG